MPNFNNVKKPILIAFSLWLALCATVFCSYIELPLAQTDSNKPVVQHSFHSELPLLGIGDKAHSCCNKSEDSGHKDMVGFKIASTALALFFIAFLVAVFPFRIPSAGSFYFFTKAPAPKGGYPRRHLVLQRLLN